MSDEHVQTLRRARENFVRKRRVMAEQMIPLGAAAAHFAPTFPPPFEKVEHAFDRYADAVTWFGDPEVIHTPNGELARRTILSRHP